MGRWILLLYWASWARKALYHSDVCLCFYGIEVDPSTVCEYTSLTDKNGKKVFVGDIVKCSRGCTHEVVWVQEHGGTFIGGMPAVYLSGLNPGYAWTGAEEIIGNIHDGEGGRHEGGRQ